MWGLPMSRECLLFPPVDAPIFVRLFSRVVLHRWDDRTAGFPHQATVARLNRVPPQTVYVDWTRRPFNSEPVASDDLMI